MQWWYKLLFELSYGSDFITIELFLGSALGGNTYNGISVYVPKTHAGRK
jgi:hypothetical protein